MKAIKYQNNYRFPIITILIVVLLFIFVQLFKRNMLLGIKKDNKYITSRNKKWDAAFENIVNKKSSFYSKEQLCMYILAYYDKSPKSFCGISFGDAFVFLLWAFKVPIIELLQIPELENFLINQPVGDMFTKMIITSRNMGVMSFIKAAGPYFWLEFLALLFIIGIYDLLGIAIFIILNCLQTWITEIPSSLCGRDRDFEFVKRYYVNYLNKIISNEKNSEKNSDL